MNLNKVTTIFKMLQHPSTSIMEVVEGEEKNYASSEFANFAIFRRKDANSMNLEEKDFEKLHVFAQLLKITNPSDIILASEGYYVVPLYAGQTEFKPLRIEAADTLVIDDEPIFTLPNSPLKEENKGMWSDYPCAIFQTVFDMLGITDWACDAAFNTNIIDDNISKLKTLTDFKEIIQKLRIKVGNTVVNNIFISLGKTQFDEMKEEGGISNDTTKWLLKEYKKVTDYIIGELKKKNPNKENYKINERAFNKYGDSKIIPDFYMWKFLDILNSIEAIEDDVEKMVVSEVRKHDIWNRYLAGVKGCGEQSAAYLISILNPYKSRHPSGFLRYAGLDVRPDPKNPGKYKGTDKSCTRPTVFINKSGEADVANTLGYHTLIKARVVGVLVPCLIKAGGTYANIYHNVKYYYENRPDLKEVFASKCGRSAHKMAIRKVACMFLEDLWLAWRSLLGLPLNNGRYEEAKLNIIHNYNRPSLGDPNPDVVLNPDIKKNKAKK